MSVVPAVTVLMETLGNEVVENALEQLNTCSFQPRRKLLLRKMEKNKKYRILSAKKVLKLNKSKKMIIKLEVEKYFIYLPQRFLKIPDFVLNEMNKQTFEICNTGPWKTTHNLEFSNLSSLEPNAQQNIDIAEYMSNFDNLPQFYNVTENE